ncbi:MAG: aminotransferase class IV [Bacteroidales bacterium]
MRNKPSNLVILNGTALAAKEFNPGSSVSIIYEVVRLMDGQLLFLDDHLERLQNSCAKAGEKCPEKAILISHLKVLISKASISNGNIRLLVYEKGGETHIACFFVPHFYPSVEDYRNGVLTRTYSFERPEPTVKRWNEKFRRNVSKFIQQNKIYEAILLNARGELTEGSRSNLFFIDKHSSVHTAAEKMILPGITRKYVLQLCKTHNFRVVEKAVSKSEAENMKSCFISGTSPKVLPIKQLDSITYDVQDPVLKTIMDEFNQMIQNMDAQ